MPEKEFRQAIAGPAKLCASPIFTWAVFWSTAGSMTKPSQQFLRALQPESEQTPVYLYALAATYSRAGDREHALTYFHRRATVLWPRASQLVSSIDRDLKTLGSQP